jgi:hypothetical protein
MLHEYASYGYASHETGRFPCRLGSGLVAKWNAFGDLRCAGVYLFHCKVHPYITAVVGVKNAAGNIPDVTASMLPFIGHLGVNSLPATTVLSVITTIAPTDADKRAKWDILNSTAQVRPKIPGVGEVWVDTQFERWPTKGIGAASSSPEQSRC